MDAQTINQTFDLLALAERHTHLRKAGAYYQAPCPFCGGRDRFTLKSTPNGWRWHCRRCGDGKYHTAIDFVMRLDNVDFKTALQRMGGEVAKPNGKPPKSAPRPIELPPEEWQRATLSLVTEWADRLESTEAQPARDYLKARGFHAGTWNAWLLGCTEVYGRPAVAIPWLDANGQGDRVFAVKFRYIDEQAGTNKGARFSMRKGSKPFLFGLQHMLDSDDTLLLVEGEMNAMSIWQCLPRHVAVVSMGSQSNEHPELLQALASRFKRGKVGCQPNAKSGDPCQVHSR
jgi:DNA primase